MSLEDLPSYVADFTGTTEFSAGIILSLIVICALIFPTIILARNSDSLTLITLFMFFFGEALAVGFGWLDAWVMIATVVIMAIGVSLIGTKAATGG